MWPATISQRGNGVWHARGNGVWSVMYAYLIVPSMQPVHITLSLMAMRESMD